MAKFMELMGLYFMENLVEPQDRSLNDFHQTLAADKGIENQNQGMPSGFGKQPCMLFGIGQLD